MIKLTRKMYRCAMLLKKGSTDTKLLSRKWGCNFWTAQFRLKRLKMLGVIETEISRDNRTGKFSGIEIIKINPFTLRNNGGDNDSID